MLKRLNQYYLKQLFKPDLFSVFINPFYFVRKRLYASVKKNAPLIKGRIMDLGCGLKPYKHLFVNATEYIGVDIENPGHDHSKENVDVFYNGKNIPFENGSFDAVFFSETLEHIFNPTEILIEVKRILKKDGLVLITIPFVWDEHEIPYDYGRYTSFGIKYLLENNGYEIIKIEKTGHFVETVSQQIVIYLHHVLYTNNKYFNMLINIIFISPFTICGIILSAILPRKYSMYMNNVVLAKKLSN